MVVRELEECSRIFLQLEMQRTETLAELGGWLPACVAFRPAPGVWCAVEVLDHIIRAESGTMAAVRTGLRNPHVLGTEDRPRIAALDRALRSEQSFTVPAGAEEIYPDSLVTLPIAAERWNRTRAELGEMIAGLKPEDARCGVLYHPFAGWMTFAEVLDHFHAHLYHHGFQLARLRVSSEVLL